MMQSFRRLWTGNPSSCCFSCSLADALDDLWKCPALICSLPSIFETKSSLKDFSWFVCPMQGILNMSKVFTALAMFLALSVVLPATFSEISHSIIISLRASLKFSAVWSTGSSWVLQFPFTADGMTGKAHVASHLILGCPDVGSDWAMLNGM